MQNLEEANKLTSKHYSDIKSLSSNLKSIQNWLNIIEGKAHESGMTVVERRLKSAALEIEIALFTINPKLRRTNERT